MNKFIFIKLFYLVYLVYNMFIWAQSNAPITTWSDVASDSLGINIVAVVNGGGIYTSINSGVSWTLQTNPPTAAWSSVASNSTGTNLVAVVNGGGVFITGGIYTSSDSGATWTQQSTGLPSGGSAWSGVASSSTGTKLVAVVNGGGIYYSSNSGTTWAQSNASNGSWGGVTSSSDGSLLEAYSNDLGLYTSSDSGSTWTNRFGTAQWSGTTSSASGSIIYQCYQVGGGGVYYSTNGGSNWSPTPTVAPQKKWTCIACSSDGSRIIVGSIPNSDNGQIYTSPNGGNTWTLQTSAGLPTSAAWQSVSISSDGSKYVAVVNGGGIYTYYDQLVCFLEGSKILTDKGYIPIQDLRKGDLVKTMSDEYKPIYMIGKKEIYNPACDERIKDQLYKCSQDKYPEVFEDLIITGYHSILVDDFKDNEREMTQEVLGNIYITGNKYRLPACVDERTTIYEKKVTCTIYHVALENEHYYGNYGIYANGLLVETCSKRFLKELSNMTIIE